MAGLGSPFHSFDSLDISAKFRLRHDHLASLWKPLRGKDIPHSATGQTVHRNWDTFVLLTDFPFTAYKASGTLRNADHVEQFF